MCGIFGIVYSNGSQVPSSDLLLESGRRLFHRGPDGTGHFSEPGIGLVHQRLSLVDLDPRSDQPLWDSTRRYCLIYNGEIYNFRELREDLRSRGVQFFTTSDTEVILQSLIFDGAKKTLENIRGMFAFAFYDKKARQLTLARDRFGIKPLHIYHDSEKFIFGSEVKALQPWIQLQPNTLQMTRYLMNFGAPIRNAGFYANVEIVPPGSVIRLDIGSEPQFESFGSLPDMISSSLSDELESLSKEQVVDRVDELLQRSVQRMLFADAPVGALCSGGVDSSVLMAMAARKHGNLAIFHADVVGPLSEFDAATALAKHLNLDLLTVKAHDQDFLKMTPEVLYHYEQPFSGHPHSVPFMMVAKLVQESGVKGVLTGEGSDECFLGYSYVAHEPFWAFYRRQIALLERISSRIPVIGAHLWNTESRAPELVTDMLGQFEQSIDQSLTRDIYKQRLGRDPGRNIRTVDLLGNHLRTLLHRNDTMGMAASIEARFPFLDEQLVETAINLPYRHKIKFSPQVWEKEHPFLRDKWVLRKVADRYLPKELSQRKKRGFEVSAFQRIKVDRNFFKTGFVTEHFRLGAREADYLFAAADQRLTMKLMMLEAWGQLFIRGVDTQVLRQQLEKHTSFNQRI